MAYLAARDSFFMIWMADKSIREFGREGIVACFEVLVF
jgi:hypothetical protein